MNRKMKTFIIATFCCLSLSLTGCGDKEFIYKLEEDKSKLNSDLENLKKENSQLKTDLKNSKNDNKKINEDLSEITEENNELKIDLQKAREVNSRLVQRVLDNKEANAKKESDKISNWKGQIKQIIAILERLEDDDYFNTFISSNLVSQLNTEESRVKSLA